MTDKHKHQWQTKVPTPGFIYYECVCGKTKPAPGSPININKSQKIRKSHKKNTKNIGFFKKLLQKLCPMIFGRHNFSVFGVDGMITLGGKRSTSQAAVDKRSYMQCSRCKLKKRHGGVVKMFKTKKKSMYAGIGY